MKTNEEMEILRHKKAASTTLKRLRYNREIYLGLHRQAIGSRPDACYSSKQDLALQTQFKWYPR